MRKALKRRVSDEKRHREPYLVRGGTNSIAEHGLGAAHRLRLAAHRLRRGRP